MRQFLLCQPVSSQASYRKHTVYPRLHRTFDILPRLLGFKNIFFSVLFSDENGEESFRFAG